MFSGFGYVITSHCGEALASGLQGMGMQSGLLPSVINPEEKAVLLWHRVWEWLEQVSYPFKICERKEIELGSGP